MKKYLLNLGLIATFILGGNVWGQTFTTIAEDDASNYGSGWTNGSNGGDGFGNWDLFTSGGSAGFFIGNSTQNGRQSINTGSNQAFAMFTDSGDAFARRVFNHNDDNELKPGEKFIFEVSFSWADGRRGIDIWAQDDYTEFLMNIEHQGNDRLTIFPSSAGSTRVDLTPDEFNEAWRIEITWNGGTTDNLLVTAFRVSDDQEVGTELLTVSSTPKSFTLLYTDGPTVENKSNFEPYFNSFSVERPTYTTANDGDFYNASTWVGEDIPATNGIINIEHNVILDADYILEGELNIASGKTLAVAPSSTLTNNGSIDVQGNLLFASTQTGTAQYGNSSGTINGNVTAERFIPSRRAYRFIASPVSGVSIANAWQQQIHITGAQGNVGVTSADGFDQTASGAPSMFTYNSSNQSWENITNTNNTNLEAGKAYRVLVRGSRETVDLSTNDSPSSNVSLSATGTLATGSFSVPDIALGNEEFSFVGNPYQAIVNLGELSYGNGIESDFAYYWDSALADNGAFVSINISSNSNEISDGTIPQPGTSAANKFLQPSQAVFFRNTNSAGDRTITFTEASKSTGEAQTQVFSQSNIPFANIRLYETNRFNEGGREQDAIGLRWHDEASLNQFTNATKMGNTSENFAVVNGSELNGIRHLAFPGNEAEYQLFLNNHQHGNYTFWLNLQNLPENTTAYLVDQYLDEETALEDGLNTIDFTTDESVSESVNIFRFKLKLKNQTFSNENFELTDFSLYPNPASAYFNLNMPKGVDKALIRVYSITGKLIEQTEITSTKNSIDVSSYSNGVYLVEIQSNKNKTTKKLIIK